MNPNEAISNLQQKNIGDEIISEIVNANNQISL
jgi:hypothetical protein